MRLVKSPLQKAEFISLKFISTISVLAGRISFGLAIALGVGCASGPGSSVSSKSERSKSKSGYQLPDFQEKTLANGLRVLFVPDDKLPYISFSMLVKSGSAQDPVDQSGLASFVAELLDKGTAKRSAPQIAQDLGQLGADFEATATYDYSMVTASSVSTQAEPLLKTFVEVITQPSFSDAEIARVRVQTLAQIAKRVDNPDAFADLAFSEMLYGTHPYGRPSTGSSESVNKLKKKAIIQHYLRTYRPGNAILAVVGKYTPEFATKIETIFSSWQKRELQPFQFPQPLKTAGVKIRLADKPGLVQAQIRVGHIGIKRQNEDFLALRMANTILGGAFASRLNDRIRKQLGLTYSINSYFDARKEAGPFEIGTFTKNASVGQTVAETLKLLKEFKEKGVSQVEVDRVKGYLKGIFPTAIETAEKLAYNLLVLRLYEIPDSYLTNYLSDIDQLTVRDINTVIRKYVDDTNIDVLVYSSAPEVLSQLQPLSTPPNSVEVLKAGQP